MAHIKTHPLQIDHLLDAEMLQLAILLLVREVQPVVKPEHVASNIRILRRERMLEAVRVGAVTVRVAAIHREPDLLQLVLQVFRAQSENFCEIERKIE